MSRSPPLIVTLALDAASFERFDGERRRWFPPALNRIPAHVTLFHRLPGDERTAVASDLETVAAEIAPFAVAATGLRKLGRGTAYVLRSADLDRVRASLASRWAAWLTAQDRQPFRPHVTIQNKAAPEEARALHDRLASDFRPFEVRAEGLLLWRYLGGPWEDEGRFSFRS